MNEESKISFGFMLFISWITIVLASIVLLFILDEPVTKEYLKQYMTPRISAMVYFLLAVQTIVTIIGYKLKEKDITRNINIWLRTPAVALTRTSFVAIANIFGLLIYMLCISEVSMKDLVFYLPLTLFILFFLQGLTIIAFSLIEDIDNGSLRERVKK